MKKVNLIASEIINSFYATDSQGAVREFIIAILKERDKERDAVWTNELESRGFCRTAAEISSKFKDK